MRADRPLVRLGIPALLLASCAAATAVSWHAEASEIPSFAFHSHVVLAVQLALLFFYAALLLLVPTIRALVDGDLPIELSLRGARWTEREDWVGFGGDFMARMEGAEDEARQADSETREEVKRLKAELREFDGSLDRITDQLLEQIALIETKLMSQGRQS
jgi:hypothetical protein